MGAITRAEENQDNAGRTLYEMVEAKLKEKYNHDDVDDLIEELKAEVFPFFALEHQTDGMLDVARQLWINPYRDPFKS